LLTKFFSSLKKGWMAPVSAKLAMYQAWQRKRKERVYLVYSSSGLTSANQLVDVDGNVIVHGCRNRRDGGFGYNVVLLGYL
jgi:hypothetical protein